MVQGQKRSLRIAKNKYITLVFNIKKSLKIIGIKKSKKGLSWFDVQLLNSVQVMRSSPVFGSTLGMGPA